MATLSITAMLLSLMCTYIELNIIFVLSVFIYGPISSVPHLDSKNTTCMVALKYEIFSILGTPQVFSLFFFV